jgi:hypothetical protein
MEHCSIKDDNNNMIIIRVTIMAHRNIYKICVSSHMHPKKDYAWPLSLALHIILLLADSRHQDLQWSSYTIWSLDTPPPICCPCGGAYVGAACLGGIHGACPAGAWGIASEVLVASGVVDEVGHALDASVVVDEVECALAAGGTNGLGNFRLLYTKKRKDKYVRQAFVVLS